MTIHQFPSLKLTCSLRPHFSPKTFGKASSADTSKEKTSTLLFVEPFANATTSSLPVHDGVSLDRFPSLPALGSQARCPRRPRPQHHRSATRRSDCLCLFEPLQGRDQGLPDPRLWKICLRQGRGQEQALLVLHGWCSRCRECRWSQEHCARWVIDGPGRCH